MIESAKISWKIGYREKNGEKPLVVIKNPWWGWCADPFLFEYQNETYVFAEIWNYFTQRGSIGYYKIEGEKCDGKWHTVIAERFHMSYPFIWKDQEGIHICAETCGVRKIGLYSCVDFPKKWTYDKDLVSGEKFADSTFLLETNSNKPLYCFTHIVRGINRGELVKFTFDEKGIIQKEGIKITENPRIARPGGNFLRKDNYLLRVAQDCSESYGESIVFMKVKQLEPYQEEEYASIKYSDFQIPKCIGTHTYNVSSKYEVFDFRIKSFNLINILGTHLRLCLRRVKRAFVK